MATISPRPGPLPFSLKTAIWAWMKSLSSFPSAFPPGQALPAAHFLIEDGFPYAIPLFPSLAPALDIYPPLARQAAPITLEDSPISSLFLELPLSYIYRSSCLPRIRAREPLPSPPSHRVCRIHLSSPSFSGPGPAPMLACPSKSTALTDNSGFPVLTYFLPDSRPLYFEVFFPSILSRPPSGFRSQRPSSGIGRTFPPLSSIFLISIWSAFHPFHPAPFLSPHRDSLPVSPAGTDPFSEARSMSRCFYFP